MAAMLRRRVFGLVIRLVAGAMAAALALPAQTTVKLRRNVGADPLQAAIAELTVPSHMKDAQQRLWRAGEAAVPLLAAEVARDGAGEGAARFVLEQLGCEAAAAVPVLRRIVDDDTVDAVRRARVAATLARIDGPPIVLVPMYGGGAVVEFDLDGNELRRVAVDAPWGAWPLPDGEVGALSFNTGSVVRVARDGTQTELRRLENASGSLVALDDALLAGARLDCDIVFTTWQDKGQLIRRDAAGKDVWKHEIDAVRVERDFGDELIVLTRADPRVVWFSLDGEQLRSLPLPEMCHNAQRLLDGGLLVASHSDKVFEFAPDGTKCNEFQVSGIPNDVVRLHDGRTLFSTDSALGMLAADGKELWKKDIQYGGPLFVRMPRRDVR